MTDRNRIATLLSLSIAALASRVIAQPAPPGGVVSHITILSDKTDDVSSLEAWKRSFIKPGMTDREKAMAVWESVVRYRHQEIPPNEYLSSEGHPHDPIKDFNVYGYGQCCCASANVEALARYAGLPARGWGIIGHSVPEIQWDGRWHMLDGSLMTFFPKPDGALAGVEEITANLAEWYTAHPDLKNDHAKLDRFMRNGGWKNGPELLANCPIYDNNGWLPAATHGWSNTMQEYGDPKKTFLYEYGTALGYEVNIQLRRGEKLTRNWSNKGLHVNALEGGPNGSINAVVGKDQYRYTPAHGDVAPGRIGNGTIEYDVPLAYGGFRAGALVSDNLAARSEDLQSPALHVADAAKPGVLEMRMPCSYVYLGGNVALDAIVAPAGQIAIALSDNNGLDWKNVTTLTASGQQNIDLKSLVYRRYDYRLRFAFKGSGTGLASLKITNDIQHSQRALPALDVGANQITFSAGPSEGTIVIEGSTNPASKGKNLLLADFHPEIHNLDPYPMKLTAATGDITLPVTTPGDLKRLRIGAHYRARDAKDGFDIQASFDGGKTFQTINRLAGPTPGNSAYFTFTDIPANTRSTLIKLAGQQRNTTVLFDLRISADYAEPHAATVPIRVTYVWEEGGAEKRDVHVSRKPEETYTIQCAQKPLLKSLIVEQAN